MPKEKQQIEEVENVLDFLKSDLDDISNEVSEEEQKAIDKKIKEAKTIETKEAKAQEKKSKKNKKEAPIEKAVDVPVISEKDVIKKIKSNPDLLEAIKKELGFNVPSKEDDSLEKLAGLLSTLIKGKGTEGVKSSNAHLQSALANANNQAILNLENFKKKFTQEQAKGEVSFVYIDPAYKDFLPTRSIVKDGKKITYFEISLNGVLFNFKVGYEYSNTPISVAKYINRKIARYLAVVSSKTTQEKISVAFDIIDNAGH